ncbi:hypothetical protein Btru_020828 [Bulinus truncatus]|nr:hypothetical protein Btru_020828 [Bulinus truncatus]
MEEFPPAFVIASREAVSHNNNVLYRLVRPLADGSGVESVDRLVNVVPHRRTYCMERKKEIDDFRHEILRRPLVLQPVLHFGRGFGHRCGACYSDESWIIMINQTHPKILSRLQVGLDMAKRALEKGQSFEIQFDFGEAIQRVYREHLRQKEIEEATQSVSGIDDCLVHFRFAEWEHCRLVVRSHGYAARLNRSAPLFALPNLELIFKFEDIGMHEMVWSQVEGQQYNRPHLSRVTEDEIRYQLPGWTINSVSPLADIGEDVPEHNYSYAQAGRLYESFRKKKRQRNKPSNDTDYEDQELQGAVGYDPNFKCVETSDIVLKSNGQFGKDVQYHNANHSTAQYPPGHHSHSDSGVEDDLERNVQVHQPFSNRDTESAPFNGARQKLPTSTKPPSSSSVYDKLGAASDYHRYTMPTLKKQDSDRSSSRSTNADSGYSPENDGHPSREDSYDYNDNGQPSRAKSNKYVNDSSQLLAESYPKMGLNNPSFQDYESIAMQKHSELVASVLQEQTSRQRTQPRTKNLNTDHQSRLPEGAVTLSPKELLPVNQTLSPQYTSYKTAQNTGAKVTESYI